MSGHGHESVPCAAPGPDEPWDDATMDGIAIVEAIARDDVAGLAVLLVHSRLPEVVVSLGKILAEGFCPRCLESGEFRRWARQAVTWGG